MTASKRIERIKRSLYGWSLILFPVMLLLGFLLHPDVLTLHRELHRGDGPRG